MSTPVIYTEKNNCQDCYRCIKQCPVKAIKVEENSASIVHSLCIYCGRCIQSCPVKAKKYREDLDKAQLLIDSGEKVVACLAPSWISDFPEYSPLQWFTLIKKLGFYAVSETAIAAEWITETSRKWLEKQPAGVYLSSCCPVVVNYICKYVPEFKNNLAPVFSPMLAHGYLMKQTYGNDIKTVFIGPCVAKKEEADAYDNTIDAVITFQELRKWIEEEKISINKTSDDLPDEFVIGKPKTGKLFPIDGGMLANIKKDVSATDVENMTFSGINNIREVLNEVQSWNVDHKIFLELLACEGGCIKGPGTYDKEGLASKRLKIISHFLNSGDGGVKYKELTGTGDAPETHFTRILPAITCVFNDEDIRNVLFSMGKYTEKEELNCSGCGYDNCREFAKAMLEGKAERAMCISYMRKVAQHKASVLLQKMPSGVVMVDENLHIIDCNKKFAEMMGKEAQLIFETNPGLSGADLKKLLSFHKYFSSVIETGEEMIERDIREDGNFFHLSVISIQKYKIICGIIENMREPEVQKRLMISRIRDVITQNMESVQRIAYLLGENASYTESMLHSILDSNNEEEETITK
ncbi:MAG: [Fe-Fe] hydrogenase large subunit C-terminal domain-containing protein [Bacteroidota bacterium]|nr:[Fe-Fe] hydrogenase large subunit C-terminal domain-containing protein [Bacteroidota bacterium]